MAVGAIHAFEDAGIGIPDDMAVVGFDDIEAASLVRPALTTIAQDPIALGAAAVEALLTLVDTPLPQVEVGASAVTATDAASGRPAAVAAALLTPRTVPTYLVERRSCAVRR